MRRIVFVLCVLWSSWVLAQEDTLPPPSPPPPPPPVQAVPRDVPPPPDTPLPETEQPAPPPARRRDHSREYGRQPPEPESNWRAERKGFHLSLGLGGLGYPVGGGGGTSVEGVGFVALLPAVSWSWGWVEAHVTASALGYFQAGANALFVALDPQLRVNFAPWYSLGFGPYVGFAATPHVDFVLGTSISPAIVRLGSRGQHEIALWWASPTIFSRSQGGVTLLLLSYSYVFF